MDINLAREAMRQLVAIKAKISLLPVDIQEDLLLECKLIEDRIKDKFFRRR